MNKIIETINTILGQHGFNDLVHKSSTHGGEYTGSCPRCAALGMTGNNVDRLQVWPNRSLDGLGSREEPCFYCRGCFRTDDPSRPWTGDLIQFVKDVFGLSYYQARGYLELEGGEAYEGSVELKPLVSATGAPPDAWQERAVVFVVEARDRLWTDEGIPAREYLAKRGITEETMRWAILGCIATEYYEDGALWGRDGRIKIPRGIVFAEYHVVVKDGIVHREIWSISIRRPDGDLFLEEIQTGIKPAKYHFIAGSIKGLYLADTIQPDKPLLLVEGQMCALTVKQEAGDLFSVAALQSSTGCHSLTWITQILLAMYVMIGMDPDAAGEIATAYWKDIPAHKRFPWPAPGGDFNAMHMRGESVRGFLLSGKQMFESVLNAIGGISGLVAEEDVEYEVQESKEGLSVISEPYNAINDNDDRKVFDDTESMAECFVCYNKTNHIVEGIPLCTHEFGAVKLLQGGKKFSWGAFEYDGGEGLVDPFVLRYEDAPAGSIKAGKSMYLDYIKTHSPASIWLAASEINYKTSPLAEEHVGAEPLPKVRRYVDTPCDRKACPYDARESIQLHQGKVKDKNGKEQYSGTYLRPRTPGRINIIDAVTYRWCPRCTACSLILDMGACMRYPRVISDGKTIPAGKEKWIELCQNMPDREALYYLDMLRKRYSDTWKKLQDIM